MLGLAGHAAYETYSVLTRLPPPARRTPAAVGRLLAANFEHSRFLSPGRAGQLLVELADSGIAGGSVYDALVAAPAIEHALALVSRDRRALSTYRDLGETWNSFPEPRARRPNRREYALARSRGEPLLFKGNDFDHTDIEPQI